MANPTLRRDTDDSAWVVYLQELLATRLADEAAAGEVQLSAIDGDFGPITEASVVFFQQREGLTADGVVGDSTWDALEAQSAAGPGDASGNGGRTASPVDLRVPFDLRLHWDSTTIQEMLADFDTFDLARSPNAQLTLQGPVGPLAGNGTVQLFNRELPLWRNWFLEETTKFTLDWSRDKGFELGLENEADFGIRPLRNLDIFIRGEVDLKWLPQEAAGSVDWGGSLNLRYRFDLPRP